MRLDRGLDLFGDFARGRQGEADAAETAGQAGGDQDAARAVVV